MRSIPQVEIELDRKRIWRFDMNALEALMTELGDDALDQLHLISDASSKFTKHTVKIARALLWAGFVGDDPTLTALEVGKSLSLTYYNEIMVQIYPILAASLQQPKPKPNGSGTAGDVAEEPRPTVAASS
jgi:hypothetical protein